MGIVNANTNHFGLDIGAGGIRLVQLSGGGGKPRLVTYGSIPLDSAQLQSDSEIDVDKVAAALKQLVLQTKVTTKNVVVGLGASQSFVNIIDTPKLPEKELESAIKLQADQYIPMPLDQIKLDWHVIGDSPDGQHMKVFLAAAPNINIDKLLSIVQKAELNLESVELNAIALSRSLVYDKSVPVLVLDAGLASTDAVVVNGGAPVLVRSIDVGSQTLLRAATQNLNLDEAQAQQFISKFGLSQTKLEGQVLKALKPSLDTLVGELHRSIKFFSEQNQGVNIEKVMLTGAMVSIPELASYLAAALNLKAEIANPWVNISYGASLQDNLMSQAIHFGVAAGLAERSFM